MLHGCIQRHLKHFFCLLSFVVFFRLYLAAALHSTYMRRWFIMDKKHILMFRDFFNEGSLRYHIHNADLSQLYSETYNQPDEGLSIQQYRPMNIKSMDPSELLGKPGHSEETVLAHVSALCNNLIKKSSGGALHKLR